MDHLKAADLKRRDEYVERLRTAVAGLEAEHALMIGAVESFNQKLTDYNEIVTEAVGWRDDLVNEIDSYIGEKSERWQEGEKGQAVENWKSELENLELEEIELVELHDLPDLLHADTLEEMQVEAEA